MKEILPADLFVKVLGMRVSQDSRKAISVWNCLLVCLEVNPIDSAVGISVHVKMNFLKSKTMGVVFLFVSLLLFVCQFSCSLVTNLVDIWSVNEIRA